MLQPFIPPNTLQIYLCQTIFSVPPELKMKLKGFQFVDVVEIQEAVTDELTLCRSNLNPYCMGRKAAFFSVGI
jgi:hypothetical protein